LHYISVKTKTCGASCKRIMNECTIVLIFIVHHFK